MYCIEPYPSVCAGKGAMCKIVEFHSRVVEYWFFGLVAGFIWALASLNDSVFMLFFRDRVCSLNAEV